MNKNEIKKYLSRLPTMPLREIEAAWMEIVLDRSLGFRRIAYESLEISKSKLCSALQSGRITCLRKKP